MRKLWSNVSKFLMRLRYPFALPDDIADALGVEKKYSTKPFDEFLSLLSEPECCPKNLQRFMPREAAEALFASATKKERFNQRSLYSFYFYENWVEFTLHFDQESRLRRVYLNHKKLCKQGGVEIPLHQMQQLPF